MTLRATEATEHVRHEFTAEERAGFGFELATAFNRKKELEDELANIRANFKEKTTAIDLQIGNLSRRTTQGFEMVSVKCRLVYDDPQVNEVTFYRIDTGAKVRSRAMTADEMQQELNLGDPIPQTVAETLIAESQENIEQQFGPLEDVATAIENIATGCPNHPSAFDLDAVAEEDAARKETASKPDPTTVDDELPF